MSQDTHLSKTSRNLLQRREDRSAYLFLLPALILFGVFTFFPFVYSLYLSFSQKIPGGTLSDVEFAGLVQYKRLFADKDFWNSLLVSCKYTFPVVFFHVVLGLCSPLV